MSRLSDLLNPAPSQSSAPPPIDVSAAEIHHGRNQSITSPLEALAIAATESPSVALFPQPTSGSVPSQQTDEASSLPHINTVTDNKTTLEPVQQGPTVPQRLEAMGAAQDVKIETPSDSLGTAPQADLSKVVDGSNGVVSVPPLSTSLLEVKKEPTDSNPPTPSVHSPTVLPTTEGKKRSAPKITKKGTASVIKKPATKRRKVEAQSKDGTPFSQRSGTPNSSRASKTPAPKNRKPNSATPAQSPTPRSADGEEEDDDEDDGELFCICRKPDDHKWMIGCDGGCDDWFHGKCVDMKEEDAELIDKYICPNCEAKGIGETTWKPMCRLGGCREPARVTGPRPSKYCCDEHGEEFMQRKIWGKSLDSMKPAASKKKRHDENQELTRDQGNSSVEQGSHQAHLRGGYLAPPELKTLVSDTKNFDEFKRLGESVLLSSTAGGVEGKDAVDTDGNGELLCTPEERSRLEEIISRRAALNHKLEALRDKEKLLSMVKSRARDVLEELNKKHSDGGGKKKDALKDICGFDSRLSWSDVEFDQWRQSSDGLKALESGVLGPPPIQDSGVDGEGDTNMVNSTKTAVTEIGRGVCQKKRCDRHKTWYKLHQQELGSEKGECNQQLRRLQAESKGIGERAMIKKLEAES